MAASQVGQGEIEIAAGVRLTQAGRDSLEQIVRQLQVERAHGCPLHQYRLDDAALDDLKRLLLTRLRDSRRLSRAEAAAFVLYCAHRFTRTYNGGPWKWATAKESIDPEDRLRPPALYAIVERGLQAWGRSVYWNGSYNEYLYTVGREGGLPLAVLAGEKYEGLRTFLQRLLSRIETTTVPAEEAANELQSLLPATLQQPEVVVLAAELVREVASLRAMVETNDPISWLDEHQPAWRDRLPLRTNDAVATALITGLVQQAPPKLREQSFALTTQWVNGRLQRLLEMPRTATREDLIGPNGDLALPARLRIALSNGHVQSVRAMAMRLQDATYAIEPRNAKPLSGSDWFSNEVRLVISAGERELMNRPLPGGEAGSASPLPWVFDRGSDDRRVLAARGSYSSKNEDLVVVQQPGTGELQAAPGVLESLGTEPILGWIVTRVAGTARWVGEDDECEITASDVLNGVRFELGGHSERLAGGGSFVWRGPPEVRCRPIEETGAPPSRIPDSRIEWKPTGSEQPWRHLGPGCLGDIQMRVREGNRTLYRSRLTVVPPDFRIELAATKTTTGQVLLIGSQVHGARVLTRGVEASLRSESGRAAITVRSLTSPPPTELELEVEFVAAARLEVRVPFPSEFRGFVSVGGEPLPNMGRIGLETLSRWIARVVSCETRQRYVLEASTGQGYQAIAELPQASPGISELSLSRIRTELESLLSGSRSIDSTTRLRISRKTGEVINAASRAEALLGWHEAELDVEPDRTCALIQLPTELHARLTDWQLRDFHVLARPLHAPGADPVKVEGNAQDGWLFAPEVEQLWMLTGWVGNALMTRPRRVHLADLSSDPPSAASEDISLDAAMRVTDLHDRREALARVYEKLATDFGHDDWLGVDEFLHTLHQLPPPTYDVVCALAAAKPAAVVALFRQPKEHFQAVWDGLERLGVSWQTIPLGLWLRAAHLGQTFALNGAYASAFRGKEALLKACLPGLLEQLEHGPPFFPTLLAAINSYLAGFPDHDRGKAELRAARSREGRQILKRQVRDACMDLRRRAHDTHERFPPIRLSSHECCPDIDGLLRAFSLSDQAAFTHECLAAPLVAADVMTQGRSVSSLFLDDLRLLRAFDEDWFDYAHTAALTVFLGEGLEKDDEFLERLESQVLGADS